MIFDIEYSPGSPIPYQGFILFYLVSKTTGTVLHVPEWSVLSLPFLALFCNHRRYFLLPDPESSHICGIYSTSSSACLPNVTKYGNKRDCLHDPAAIFPILTCFLCSMEEPSIVICIHLYIPSFPQLVHQAALRRSFLCIPQAA